MPGLTILSWCISILACFGQTEAKKEIKSLTINYSFEQGSKVSIDGTTNVKDFLCDSKKLFTHQNAELKQEDSEKTSFNNATLDFNTSSLNCGNNGMNKDMMRAMKADRYPVISVKLIDAKIDPGKTLSLSGWTTVKINISISMAGSTKNDFIIIQGKQTANSLYRFVGQYSMLMTDFGITPPTALFGMVKVGDGIIVKFDLLVAATAVSN